MKPVISKHSVKIDGHLTSISLGNISLVITAVRLIEAALALELAG